MGNIVIMDAANKLIAQLDYLEPGSQEMLRQVQSVKILLDANNEERRIDFEIEKEERRALEKANEYANAQIDEEIRKIEVVIRVLDMIINPGTRLLGIFMNNRVRIKRDIMGYTFEETGVVGSHTLNNAQKDRYD